MAKGNGSNLLVLVVTVMLSLVLQLGALPLAAEDERLVQGVRIGPHLAGGVSLPEMLNLLAEDKESLKSLKLSLQLGDSSLKTNEITYEQLGIDLDTEKIWQKAWQIGRGGNWWQRWYTRYQVKRKGLELPLYLKVDRSKALQTLQVHTESLFIPAQNARLMVTPKDKVVILPGVPGRAPDVEQLLVKLENELTNSGWDKIQLKLEYQVLEPETTNKELLGYQITGLVSSFSTSYNTSKIGRSRNILLATSSIEGFILPPGEIFSFNQVVGQRTRERGYDEADIILNNKMVPDLGGGVCQVSSTLYNAVLRAQLEIQERHPHSLLISYVEPGLDATVAYGSKDFSFRNNTSGHLLIKSTAKNGKVTFKIFGMAESKKKVVLKSIKEKEIPPQTIYLNDPLVPQGEYILEKNGSPGIYIRVERYIYQNTGELWRQDIISRDYYPPVNRVIRTSTDPFLLSNYPDL